MGTALLERIARLGPEELEPFLGELEHAKAVVLARLAAPTEREESAGDELLTPDEVAAILKADRRFVYRHTKELGGVRLSRRRLRFSRKRVQRYVDARR